MIEIYCIVNGKVQNVSYRVYAQETAMSLGLCGWVKNLSDGTVEVVAQGTPEALKEFVEYLHEGSVLAEVDSVAVDWRSARKLVDDFSIIY
jgi:acylphosphatase